jgi:hydroxymethylglutaryl-CoA lyase
MQGLEEFIPTEKKITYLKHLLTVGFDTLDAGSFVSAKAIPQMSDTAAVLEGIGRSPVGTKLLAIVANIRGAQAAAAFASVDYLGFPLSISETFQQRNTNRSIAQALNLVQELQELCTTTGKELVIYISMGFGNPYGDPYDVELVGKFVDILATLEIGIVSLADTIGVSTPEQIRYLFTSLTAGFPRVEFGAHLHSAPDTAREKIAAAFDAGCKRFDGAIRGFGGCPMAEDHLIGNLATETIVDYLDNVNAAPRLDRDALRRAIAMADLIFPHA